MGYYIIDFPKGCSPGSCMIDCELVHGCRHFEYSKEVRQVFPDSIEAKEGRTEKGIYVKLFALEVKYLDATGLF